jgi:fructose-1,6-bisphosphatase/inositol monophosphatase family enzyme
VATTDETIAARADLLHETADHHGTFEAVAPKHNWWDWYAAYMVAREAGSSPDDAATAASRYMANVKHIVVASS